jgi:hypothetical protein
MIEWGLINSSVPKNSFELHHPEDLNSRFEAFCFLDIYGIFNLNPGMSISMCCVASIQLPSDEPCPHSIKGMYLYSDMYTVASMNTRTPESIEYTLVWRMKKKDIVFAH